VLLVAAQLNRLHSNELADDAGTGFPTCWVRGVKGADRVALVAVSQAFIRLRARGHITVLDREVFEHRTCECYCRSANTTDRFSDITARA
jgi:hypothetical protein